MPNGQRWEQLIGRTHRPGQKADEVIFDVAQFCYEQVNAFWQACADASYVQATMGDPQKILIADHNILDIDLELPNTARWSK